MSRLLLVAALVLTITGGCSFKRDPNGGIEVRLKPVTTGSPSVDAFEFVSNGGISVLALPAPQTFNDLGCVAVNATAPSFATSQCGIQVGGTDTKSSVDSTFSVVVPFAEGLTFEAWGHMGACSTWPTGTSNGIYKLGSVAATNLTTTDVVTIPIIQGQTILRGCGSFTTLFDDFSSESNGALAGQLGWASLSGSSFTVSSGILSASPSGPAEIIKYGGVVDTSLITTTMSADIASSAPLSAPSLGVGLAANSSDGLDCRVSFNMSASTIKLEAIGQTTVSSASFTASTSGGRLSCDFVNPTTTAPTIRATFTDSNGNQTSFSNTFSLSTAMSPGNAMLISSNSGQVGTFDNFRVQQTVNP